LRIKEISSGKAVLMNSNKLKGVIIYLVIIFLLIFGLVSVLNIASNSSRTTVTYSGVISEFDDLNVAQYQLDLGSGALTYNQGTFMGAAHELYKATGDAKYMTDAARAARYTMKSMVTNGVLNNEGSGDNALFKGIFVRYAMNVWKDASVDKADAGLRREIEEFLIYNGLVCWRDGVDKSEGSKWFFGGFWGEPGSSWDGRLNEQVSASTMIEAMALLIE